MKIKLFSLTLLTLLTLALTLTLTLTHALSNVLKWALVKVSAASLYLLPKQ